MARVIDFFHSLSGKPFIVQFVISLTVEGCSSPATQITSYLITGKSEEESCKIAHDMINSLSYSYRNSEGAIVHAECIGIHSIDELDYVDEDGAIELGVFQFSNSTSPEQLINQSAKRRDLPTLS